MWIFINFTLILLQQFKFLIFIIKDIIILNFNCNNFISFVINSFSPHTFFHDTASLTKIFVHVFRDGQLH